MSIVTSSDCSWPICYNCCVKFILIYYINLHLKIITYIKRYFTYFYHLFFFLSKLK